MNEFPTQSTEGLFPGPAGQLEVAVSFPKTNTAQAVAIICHPNPQQGGTMQNKVVTTMARTFHEMHFVTIRFNYRGVGHSDGEFGNRVGETDDLLALIEWVRGAHPDWPLWLAGFSFGTYIAANAANQVTHVAQLLTIAPPVAMYDYTVFKNIHCPWTVVQGGKDEVVPPEGVHQWVAEQTKEIAMISMPEAGHFFHGCLIELRQLLLTHYGAA